MPTWQRSSSVEPGDPPFVTLDELFAVDGPAERRLPAPAQRSRRAGGAAVHLRLHLRAQGRDAPAPRDLQQPRRGLVGGRITHDEVIVSWLPLYHDMGLVGLLTIPMSKGCTLVQGAPQDFLARPIRWMRWISRVRWHRHRRTELLPTRSRPGRCGVPTRSLDLSSMRVWLNGAEPVDPETFRGFFEAGERFGLRPQGAFPAFGMAEVCIAGTLPDTRRGAADRLGRQRGARVAPQGRPGRARLRRGHRAGDARHARCPGSRSRWSIRSTGEPCSERRGGRAAHHRATR